MHDAVVMPVPLPKRPPLQGPVHSDVVAALVLPNLPAGQLVHDDEPGYEY